MRESPFPLFQNREYLKLQKAGFLCILYHSSHHHHFLYHTGSLSSLIPHLHTMPQVLGPSLPWWAPQKQLSSLRILPAVVLLANPSSWAHAAPGVQVSSSFSGFSSWFSSITPFMVCYLQVSVREQGGNLNLICDLWKTSNSSATSPLTCPSIHPTNQRPNSNVLRLWDHTPKQRLHINFIVVVFRNNTITLSRNNRCQTVHLKSQN